MSVFRRKTTSGKTKEYHYKFMQGGKTFYGVCEGCVDEESAIAYEKRQRELTKQLTTQKNVKALVENFRDELSGGARILLSKAFDLSLKKPRKRAASLVQIQNKRTQFKDFVSFMKRNYPDATCLNDITESHAEDYIQHLRTKGKFDASVTFRNHLKNNQDSSYVKKDTGLSPRTINGYHTTIKEVFKLLTKDAGLQENPFGEIPLLPKRNESREAFTEAELKLIIEKATPFVRPIFMIGFFTAFREGDICNLKWSDIDFEQYFIKRRLLKTGNHVEVPIMPPLLAFLREQHEVTGDGEYVLPEHAEMYSRNPTGINYRVKKFLESLGITTTKKLGERHRTVSVKGIHSLRHTFCYFAGVAGIPLVVVQSIVGHMTADMTARYTAHADRKTKREKLSALPCFGDMIVEMRRTNLIEQTRHAIIQKVMEADDDVLNRLASVVLPPKSKRSLLRSTEPDTSK